MTTPRPTRPLLPSRGTGVNSTEAVSGSRATRTERRRKRRKLLRRAVLAAVVAVGCAGGWWWNQRNSSGQAETTAATAPAVRRDFNASVLATGAVRPRVGAEVRVGSRISGTVKRLYANIGDPVEKGRVIAELDREDLDADVEQAAAELQLAQVNLETIRVLMPQEINRARLDLDAWAATVELTEAELDRHSELHKSNATSGTELDSARERRVIAQSKLAAAEITYRLLISRQEQDLRQAEAKVAAARAALENAKVQVSYTKITAPISGVIASVATQEGETVAAGLNAPTFVTIVDLDRLQVDAFVDEVDIGKITVGQKASFTVDAYPGHEFTGSVEAIYPRAVIQENVINYDVVVAIDGRDGKTLRPEMTAAVTISLEAKENVLAIPAQAIRRDRGKNRAYVDKPGGVEEREVVVGWKDGTWIEVIDGLKEGEVVFLEQPVEKGAKGQGDEVTK